MNSAQDTLAGGLPHSEIPGSPIARISPGLFAACHVLHRLSVPRHPPDALLLRLKLMNTAAHRGKTLLPAFARGAAPAKAGAHNIRRPHMKTLLQTHPARLRRACPPRSHDKLSLHPSISTPPGFPGGISTASPNVARHRCGSPPLSALLRQRLSRGRNEVATVVEVPDGGGERDRTDDLLLAKQALSQLSYTPVSGIRKQASGIRSSDP
jgi:hypothetical protein